MADNIVFTVNRQKLGRHGETTDGWIEEYDSLEVAIAHAEDDWNHLTAEEQKHNIIEVYEDEIYFANENSSEEESDERRSWYKGYTPIRTFQA